jgi:VWFA-related protein
MKQLGWTDGSELIAAIVLCVAALVAPKPASAQETPRFEERMEVIEVLLDVVVTDREGNLVAGLNETDFIVEENGHGMELTGVDFYTTRYDFAGSSGGDPDRIPASRYFILFFDDPRTIANRHNRLFRQHIDATQESRKWIEEEMMPSDWVAVAGYGMKLKVFQDFTQDREALSQALKDASRGIDPEKTRWTSEPASATAPSLLRQLPTGKELRRQTRRRYSAMRLLAEATGHIVGRKSLMYFGVGFGTLGGAGGSAIPDRRYYPDLERALNDNNVAVYPIDLTVQGSRHAQSDFLSTLANDTGGTYYQHFVNFFIPMRAIAKENIGYYLLSYRSAHPLGESGYQKIHVAARVPQLIVRSQRGYRYGK